MSPLCNLVEVQPALGEQGVGGCTSEGAKLWWSVPAAPTRSAACGPVADASEPRRSFNVTEVHL